MSDGSFKEGYQYFFVSYMVGKFIDYDVRDCVVNLPANTSGKLLSSIVPNFNKKVSENIRNINSIANDKEITILSVTRIY